MKNFALIVGGCAFLALMTQLVIAAQYRTSPEDSLRSTRACVPATGGGTTINCSNVASASSGALTANTRYWVSCTDASYLRWGSTAPTAQAGDIILPSGSWVEFMTNDSVKYVACLNVNIDAACYIQECM